MLVIARSEGEKYRCDECGELIEGDHVAWPGPTILRFHLDCASCVAQRLEEDAAQYASYVLASDSSP